MTKTSDSKGDIIFDVICYTILTIVLFTFLYPLYFVVIASLSDPDAVYRGEVLFTIKSFTTIGYERVFRDRDLWTGFRNSVLYMVIGTLINLVVTLPAAYSLSRKDLKGRNILMMLFTFTMFFSGGLIPTYMLVQNIGLYNNPVILVLINALVVYNLIIAKTFFQTTLPDELLEASRIDGCSNTKFFLSIVLPLSKSVIAVVAMYYAVMHWNSYFNALVYLNEKKYYPLQLILRDILLSSQALANMMSGDEDIVTQQKIANVVKYCVIIISIIPMLILFPFIQKYFVKGVMIGAVKG